MIIFSAIPDILQPWGIFQTLTITYASEVSVEGNNSFRDAF